MHRGLDGPLMIVEEVDDVTYGELADVELPDGSVRRGQVLEAAAGRAMGAVVRGAAGHRHQLGHGALHRPADDGARVARHARAHSERRRRAARRRRRSDPGAATRHQRVADQPLRARLPGGVHSDRDFRHRRQPDPGARPEAADLLRLRLPHSELAAQIARQATHPARRGAVRGGVRGDGHYLRGSQLLHGGLPPHRRHRTRGAIHQPWPTTR